MQPARAPSVPPGGWGWWAGERAREAAGSRAPRRVRIPHLTAAPCLDACEPLGHAARPRGLRTCPLFDFLSNLVPAPLLALLILSALLLAGRVVLAWLPAGRLGAPGLRELPATLAASFVLYCAAVYAAMGLVRTAGLPRDWLHLLLPAIFVLGVVRWLTLPATFVPTPAPRLKPSSPLALAVQASCAAAVAIVLLGSFLDERAPSESFANRLVASIPYLALPALFEHALRELEVRASLRTSVWLGPPLLIWLVPESLVYTHDVCRTPLLFGAGVAFAFVARLRADRRALAFSAISFGALATLVAGWPLAAAGLLALAFFAPGATLLERASWPVASAILFAPLAWPLIESRPAGTTYFAVVSIPVVLFLLLACFARGWRAARA